MRTTSLIFRENSYLVFLGLLSGFTPQSAAFHCIWEFNKCANRAISHMYLHHYTYIVSIILVNFILNQALCLDLIKFSEYVRPCGDFA